MDMGRLGASGASSGVLCVRGLGAVSRSRRVCVPMMYTFMRSTAQQRFESWWYENLRLCCMNSRDYGAVTLSPVG